MIQIATHSCQRRFSAVEESVEIWKKCTHEAMTVCDIEEMGEEFCRTVEFFHRSYKRTIDRLFNGQIEDTDAVGKDLLDSVETGLKASNRVVELFNMARAKEYVPRQEHELMQAKKELVSIKEKVLAKWPFTNVDLIAESRAAYERGEYQGIEELLDELQRDCAKAS